MTSNLFNCTDQRVIISQNISLRLREKEAQRIKEELEKYKATRTRLFNNSFVTEKNEALKSSGVQEHFDHNDFKKEVVYFFNSKNVVISEKSIENYFQENSTPSGKKLMCLKEYLNIKDNVTLFFGSYENALDYEHQLLFEIIEEAKVNIAREIPKMIGIPGTILSMIGSYKGTKQSMTVREIILCLWNQFSDTNGEINNLQSEIYAFERNPKSISNQEKIDTFTKVFDKIVEIYKIFFSYDVEENFRPNGKRFSAYNALGNKASKQQIQAVAIENIYTFVLAVSFLNSQLYTNRNYGVLLRVSAEAFGQTIQELLKKRDLE